ncbi:hypothetical protein D3C72_2351170 [compost metagenome]
MPAIDLTKLLLVQRTFSLSAKAVIDENVRAANKIRFFISPPGLGIKRFAYIEIIEACPL